MAEQGNSKTTTVPESEAKNRRKLLGFFLFPIALFPLLALVSYRWQAMAALNIPPEASSNLIGVVGDTFAYYGYLLIGLAVWAVPPLTLFLGLLLVLGKSFRPGRRFLALSRGFFNSCFRLLDIFPLHLLDRGGTETEQIYAVFRLSCKPQVAVVYWI